MSERKAKLPCINCKDRYPGCQDHCENPEVLAFKEKNKKIREARAKRFELDNLRSHIKKRSYK